MSYPTRLAAVLLAMLAIGFIDASRAGAQDNQAQARAATERLVGEANRALVAKDHAALRAAIEAAFDFEVWGRFLTQPRADSFTPAQSERFRALLPGWLAHLYSEQFDRGMASPPVVGDTRPARSDVLVSATFTRENGKTLPVDWRLRDGPAGPRVIDVMVGGTSFLLLKRDEFTAMIDRGGVDALLSYMQQNSL